MGLKREGQNAHQENSIAGQQLVDQASSKIVEQLNPGNEIIDLNDDDILLDALSRGMHSV